MNIAFFTHNGNLEGAPLSLLGLASQHKNSGRTSVFLSASNGPLASRCEENGIPFTVFPNLYAHGADRSDVRTLLAEHNIDVCIVNTILGYDIVRFCKEELKKPCIWMIRESQKKDVFMRLPDFNTKVFQLANAVIFPSEFCKSVYGEFDTGNFHVVHNGVDLDAINAYRTASDKATLRKQYNLPEDAFVYTIIGTLYPLKGL